MKSFNFKIFARPRFFNLFGLFFLLYLSVAAQTFEHAKRMGCDNIDDRGAAIAVDQFGNQYSTGYFRSKNGIVPRPADFDPGPGVFPMWSYLGGRGIYVSKLDAEGNFVWAKQFEGGDGYGTAITLDSIGDVYITGRFGGTLDFDPGPGVFNLTSKGEFDLYFVKLSSAGNLVWAKSIGGTGNDEGTSIELDKKGNVYLAGNFSRTVDFDPGPDSLLFTGAFFETGSFLAKFDNIGNLIWARNMEVYGGLGTSMQVDVIGNSYFSSSFFYTADINPDLAGILYQTSRGQSDIFITKLDTAGHFVWGKAFGSSNYDYPGKFRVDKKSGNIYISGSFQGDSLFDAQMGNLLVKNASNNGKNDAFLLKMNSQGQFIWGLAIGDTSYDQAMDIRLTNDGHLYLAGSFQDSVDFDPGPAKFYVESKGAPDNTFILKLDTNRNFIRVLPILGKNYVFPESIFLDSLQNLYVTGWFYSGEPPIGPMDFDPGPGVFPLFASFLASEDIFVLKLRSCQSDTLQETVSACGNYSWNGSTYNQSGKYKKLYNTLNGCDSLQVLNLTILQPSQSNNQYLLCKNQTLQVGTRIYNTPGIYVDTLTASNGCDSIITSTLNYSIPNDTIIANGLSYTAANNQDSYQWLDCNQSFQAIAGATQQSFTPTSNGSYAVKTTKGNCADTSICVLFTSGKDLLTSQIRIYPQPVKDKLFIEMPETGQTTELVLMDALGRIVFKEQGRNMQSISVSKLPAGLYQLKIFQGNQVEVFGVVVEK